MELFKLFGTIALDNAEANKGIDDTTKKAEGAHSRISSAFSKIGSAASTVGKGVAVMGAGFAGAIGSLFAIQSATQDYTEDMGKLETAFATAGKSSEEAQATYQGFVGLLGETDTAVEASNHLAQLCTSQEELSQWTTIAAGVYGTFGDSLPLEGLTEAANETARCGTVTGSFADALNWTSASASTFAAGMSGNAAAQAAFNAAIADGQTKEDAFNAALAACNTEQERSQLITSTMTSLYGEAGAKYQEVNADLIAARQAQSDWNGAMAQAGEAVRPITTGLTEMATNLLTQAMPYLQQFASWFTANLPSIQATIEQAITYITTTILPPLQQAFQNFVTYLLPPIKTAFEWFITNLPIIAPIVTGLVAGFMGFQAVTGIINGVKGAMTAWKTATTLVDGASKLLNATLKANPIMLVVSLIMTLIGIFITAYNTSEDFRNIVDGAFNTIKSVIGSVCDAIGGFINTAWGVIEGAFNNIKGAIDTVCGVFDGLKNTVGDVINGAKDTIKGGIDAIVGFFSGMKLEFPKIKLPHFSISGNFSLNPLSIPSFGIEWYKEGAIFDEPTLFPTKTGIKGVGEAGAEAVAPLSDLMGYVKAAVAEQNADVYAYLSRIYSLLADLLPKMADNQGGVVVLDSGALVGSLAKPMDKALGSIARNRERGR